MADERLRWSDDRLDDFARELRADVGEIKAVVSQMQSEEMQQLRARATRAESAVQAGRARRIGYILTITIPILAAALGAVIGAYAAHAF